MVLFKV